MRELVAGRRFPESLGIVGDALTVLAIAVLVVSIVMPVLATASRRTERAELASGAHDLYVAMLRYFQDHGRFPSGEEFDTATLEPLVGSGYLGSSTGLTGQLLRERLLAYSATPSRGPADGFWLLIRHRELPLVFLVAHGAAPPGARPGQTGDGVFVFRDGGFDALGGVL